MNSCYKRWVPGEIRDCKLVDETSIFASATQSKHKPTPAQAQLAMHTEKNLIPRYIFQYKVIHINKNHMYSDGDRFGQILSMDKGEMHSHKVHFQTQCKYMSNI